MKAVSVQYQVHEDYVSQNQSNIRAVMEDLRANPIEGMHYSTYYLGEGKFMHINIARDQETLSRLGEREAFNQFRMGLRESGPLAPPQQENLEVIGSSQPLI